MKTQKNWARLRKAETKLTAMNGSPTVTCKAESEDICRALYCPRHARRLAYCPWAAEHRRKHAGEP